MLWRLTIMKKKRCRSPKFIIEKTLLSFCSNRSTRMRYNNSDEHLKHTGVMPLLSRLFLAEHN